MPTTRTIKYSRSWNPCVNANAMNSALEEKPPITAMRISTRTNNRARLPRTNRERKLPIPMAKRYVPMTVENWKTLSPTR